MRYFHVGLVALVALASGCTVGSGTSACEAFWRTSDDFSIASYGATARGIVPLGTLLLAAGTSTDPTQTGIIRQLPSGAFTWTLAHSYTDRSLVDMAASSARAFAVGKFNAAGWAVSASNDGITWNDLANASSQGQAQKVVVNNDFVVVLGETNTLNVVVSQRAAIGAALLDPPVTVGAGRVTHVFATSTGQIFVLLNQDSGSAATVYTSTDGGASWTNTGLTQAVAPATKAVMGGFLSQLYLSGVDGSLWNVSEVNPIFTGLSSTHAVFTMLSGYTGYPRVLLSARSTEVMLAGQTETTGVATQWQTTLTQPVSTGTATTDTYQLTSGFAAQLNGGVVFSGDYWLVGTANDSSGAGHWITRQLVCN